jgi:hypothetical protein
MPMPESKTIAVAGKIVAVLTLVATIVGYVWAVDDRYLQEPDKTQLQTETILAFESASEKIIEVEVKLLEWEIKELEELSEELGDSFPIHREKELDYLYRKKEHKESQIKF